MAKEVINKKNAVICCFIGLTIFKAVCMCCFSSDYQDALFYPFVSQFLDGIGLRQEYGGFSLQGWRNPYEYYYVNHMVPAFPYPPLMLYIESIPILIIRAFSVKNWFVFHFIMKLPILLFDHICAIVLWKLFPHKTGHITLLYCASPIILYSGYMHGQLDIIPTAILMSGVYFLIRGKKNSLFWFTVLFALSVLTKQHTVAVMPVLYLYLYRKEGFWKSISSFVGFVYIIVMAIIPYWSESFIRCVLFNREQGQIMNVYIDYDTLKFIIPVFTILVLYLKAFYLDRINQELLLNYCGIIFTVFLAFVAPMPGWYTWIVPFITIFFIHSGMDKYKNFFLYLIFNGNYLLYFLFFHQKGLTDLYFCKTSLSYIKVENQVLSNQVFTVMTGFLLYIIYQMYRLGIVSNSLYKRGNVPFSIGISGDSGSGKSQMLLTMEMLFGKKNVLEIEGDGDHKWKRGENMWKYYTHLDPKANYLYRQANDIRMLKQGKSVYRVEYNHETGTFSNPHKIRPRKIIVVCGLHSLYLPQMRKCLDLKIYMDTQENLRRYWKIRRDMEDRGYSGEKITKQIESRMEDSGKYILPQKEYADIVVKFYDVNLENDYRFNEYAPEISLKITLSSEIDLESIVMDLQEEGIEVQHNYEKDLNRQSVVVEGKSIRMASIRFDKIARKNIPQLEELTTQNFEMDNLRGIIALFVLAVVSNRLRQ